MNHLIRMPKHATAIVSNDITAQRNIIKSYINNSKNNLVIVEDNIGVLDLTYDSRLLYWSSSNERVTESLENYSNIFFIFSNVHVKNNHVLAYKEPTTNIKNVISMLYNTKRLINCYYTTTFDW